MTSPADATATPVTQPQPGLDLVKAVTGVTDVNSSGITDAGDTIAYSFTVTNTGNVPVDAVGVSDLKLAAQGITISCDPTTLSRARWPTARRVPPTS